jgi:H+/Cl- antiporter ClcA
MGSPRWAWLRTLIYVLVTAAIAWWWTDVTAPPANEVDPPDDMLPVREFVWLLILGSGLVTALVAEVLIARRNRQRDSSA